MRDVLKERKKRYVDVCTFLRIRLSGAVPHQRLGTLDRNQVFLHFLHFFPTVIPKKEEDCDHCTELPSTTRERERERWKEGVVVVSDVAHSRFGCCNPQTLFFCVRVALALCLSVPHPFRESYTFDSVLRRRRDSQQQGLQHCSLWMVAAAVLRVAPPLLHSYPVDPCLPSSQPVTLFLQRIVRPLATTRTQFQSSRQSAAR